jgi:hypothetical protein
MRSFAQIPPTVWQTDLKKLRGDPEAMAVHYYLTTSPSSNMIGIYPLPMIYLAHAIWGSSEGAYQGASKGLRRVIEAGIASYDEETEIVWVHEMSSSQIGARLAPKDNKVSAVAKLLATLPICPITLSFYERFRDLYHLRDQIILDDFERGFQGALEGLRSKEKDKEQEKEREQDLGQEKGNWAPEKKEYTRAIENGDVENEAPELPFDPPSRLEESRAFVMRMGVPSQFQERAMQRHMRGALFPYDIETWKAEARATA